MFRKFILAICLLTACSAFGSKSTEIVVSNSYLNQNTTDNNITIFTPEKTGIYRITFYVEAISFSSGSFINGFAGNVGYTSTNGSVINGFSFPNSSIATQNSIVIRALANDDVTTEIQEGSAIFNYDLYIVVERIDQ